MPKQRLNPEKILKRVQEEERQEQRGKLKIYLGAAPGVGKTYSMLQDALAKRAQGLDVVIGVVESHGRSEINALINEFEILPPQRIEYHGRQLPEFDLDAALRRNPGLILVDEMAHTNAPGLRHSKRWQDIKEILDRGIDVYTTLNIQHVESLNDIISQIIHTRIKETVPDFMLELANTIELVDLPPEELLKRLQEGKVYFPQQADIAASNFFRKGNLIALRELALRTTAERVGEQVLLYRQGEGIRYIWPTKEKLLVCVGSKPASAKVIRATRRMAANFEAEWIAIYVDVPMIKSSDEKRNKAIQNLKLAEQLGAETKILTGTNIVNEVMNFAREQNITKIIIGKHIRPRWKDRLFRSLADELIRNSGEIDVSVITGDAVELKMPSQEISSQPIPWKAYAFSIIFPVIISLINLLLSPYLDSVNLIMLYVFGVIIVALFGCVGPSALASFLSIFAYGFLFTPPSFTFSLSDFQYTFTFLVTLIASYIISKLTMLTYRQSEAAHITERYTTSLHALSRELASTRGVDKLLDAAVKYISELFESEVLALLPDNQQLKIHTQYNTDVQLNDKEMGVAQWVYDLGQVAGMGTDTLPFSDSIYVPLLTTQETIGVLRVHPIQPKKLFTPEKMRLLQACANQIAVAIEVDRLQEQTKKTELKTETDRVRNALLQSVSHDLQNPIVSIIGSASTLMEMSKVLDTKKIKELGEEIYSEADQLNRLITNLLQITYLEAETVKLKKQLHSLADTIALIKHLNKKIRHKSIHLHFSDNIPEAPFDDRLIQEVIINLLDNAVKFTPLDSPIDIFVSMKDPDTIMVSIEDKGPGIMPDEINKLFEKFYRGRMLTSEHGLGLGLAICRNIIKAHGGEIWAENRKEGGAAFRFTLPIQKEESSN